MQNKSVTILYCFDRRELWVLCDLRKGCTMIHMVIVHLHEYPSVCALPFNVPGCVAATQKLTSKANHAPLIRGRLRHGQIGNLRRFYFAHLLLLRKVIFSYAGSKEIYLPFCSENALKFLLMPASQLTTSILQPRLTTRSKEVMKPLPSL